MAIKTGNYCAFYVTQFGTDSNLAANSVRDFVYYNMLRAWKGKDSTFPFTDSHAKNYNVRDGSDWDKTLKPRIRERLAKSKNIVLFLSSTTKSSRALREEIDYGINTKGLPVIVVYPEFKEKSDIINCNSETFRKQIKDLWDKLPIFRNSMGNVPTMHIPNNKTLIRSSLKDPDLIVSTKADPTSFYYKC